MTRAFRAFAAASTNAAVVDVLLARVAAPLQAEKPRLCGLGERDAAHPADMARTQSGQY